MKVVTVFPGDVIAGKLMDKPSSSSSSSSCGNDGQTTWQKMNRITRLCYDRKWKLCTLGSVELYWDRSACSSRYTGRREMVVLATLQYSRLHHTMRRSAVLGCWGCQYCWCGLSCCSRSARKIEVHWCMLNGRRQILPAAAAGHWTTFYLLSSLRYVSHWCGKMPLRSPLKATFCRRHKNLKHFFGYVNSSSVRDVLNLVCVLLILCYAMTTLSFSSSLETSPPTVRLFAHLCSVLVHFSSARNTVMCSVCLAATSRKHCRVFVKVSPEMYLSTRKLL